MGKAMLSRGAMLLIMDNFEQVIGVGAPLVAQWRECREGSGLGSQHARWTQNSHQKALTT